MLNIINLLKKNKIIRVFNNNGSYMGIYKRYIPLSKEWNISLYKFNKNPIRFLPAVHDYLFKLLKWYFNMVNENMKKKIKSDKIIKLKRSLGSKVWISIPEIKYINEKMNITVYVYNRLYNQYKKQLNILGFIWGPEMILEKKEYHSNKEYGLNKKYGLNNKIKLTKYNNIIYLKPNKTNYSQSYYMKIIKLLKWKKLNNIKQLKLSILNLIKKDKIYFFKGLKALNIERYNYLINQFKKELTYFKLKQKMLFNELKFSELYLTPLIYLLQTIYKKKIKFNIIMLKNYYLSSSILSQIIIAKIVSLKNRGKPLRPIINSLKTLNTPNLSKSKLQKIKKTSIVMQNIILNKLEYKEISLNKFLLTNKKSKIWSSQYIDNLVLKNLENKSIAGIYIKASGRLTKRFKAQRAVTYLRHKGTLKNVYSAYEAYSSVLSRGYKNINIEKTTIHSKVRIGAFGITGWVASY